MNNTILDELIKWWGNVNFSLKKIINEKDKNLNTDQFELELIPQPYIGDLRNAKIFICNINPGLSDDDSNLEAEGNTPYLKDEFIKQIKQKDLSSEYPFLWLNPQYKDTSGFGWWREHTMFKQFADFVCKHNENVDREELFKWLAKNVVALELVPYHSKTINLNKLPESARFMKNFLNDKLIDYVKENELVLIVNRGYDKWLNDGKIPEGKYVFIYNRKGRAKPCLNPSARVMKGGEVIYNYMRDNHVFDLLKKKQCTSE